MDQTDVAFSTLEINKDIIEDSLAKALIQPFKSELDEQMKKVIGYAQHELNNKPGRGESTLGNFVADLLLIQSERKYTGSVDIAVINAHGGLRVPISEGAIRVEHIYELMPFENAMWILELSSEQVQQFFDHCAKTMRNVAAGAEFSVRDGKAVSIKIQGKDIEPNRRYTLAISDYLAQGGGGFSFLKETKFVEDLQYPVRDMILNHIAELHDQGRKIEAKLDERIKL
ncbi:5'-nucleotidase C-terminal domain-containing protein [Fulvivirgaceae bacterium BMA10]|uniref:5'-nucleotidase C-terminal domain-containing protein n=1 Tax=Splendidivirga corallicola TaxID=3051826 RepID=A0ABT8KSV9_9BACT|nr:5'-nucleotidase C-terminal domain-containing protein [Fulvivirgaceae bacterium BMA10]